MTRTIWITTAGVALILVPAHAQTVNVWPGVAPGSEHWIEAFHNWLRTLTR